MTVRWIAPLLLLLAACGSPTIVTARPPAEIPKVRIQVAVPPTYKGFPLTITATPLPTPVSETILGTQANQYEFALEQEELEGGSFQLLEVDQQSSMGRLVGNVTIGTEIMRFDLERNGTPAIVAFLLVPDAVPTAPPRLKQVVLQWRDGHQAQYTYT